MTLWRSAANAILTATALGVLLGVPSAARALPDGRAYEKVSPDAKNTLDAESWGLRATSPSGDRHVFVMHAAIPGAVVGRPTEAVGIRAAHGWDVRLIDPPPAGSASPVGAVLGLSRDMMSSVTWSFADLAPGAVAEASQFYRATHATENQYELITPNAVPGVLNNPALAGTTADLSTVFYEYDGAPLTSDLIPSQVTTYVWANGQTRLVGVLPDGSLPPDGSRPGSSLKRGSVERVLSGDGKRMVFHAIDFASQTDPGPFTSTGGQLYVREDDGSAPPTTRHVSASQRVVPDPAGPLPAFYFTAEAEHGSKVLFTSCEKLTDDSTARTSLDGGAVSVQCTSSSAENGELAGRDLYLYDLEANGGAGELTDLTTADLDGGKVMGVVGASESLDRIYFVAGGVLDAGAEANAANLYLWTDGGIRFIATLGQTFGDDDADNWDIHTADKVSKSRVSPDGNSVLITTRTALTGYDNINPDACPPEFVHAGPDGVPGTADDVFANPGGRCSEVYLYDANADELTCVSCRAAGPPQGDSALYQITGGFATVDSPDPLPGNLSEDGTRVFFESRDVLDPADINGKLDVYQWHEGDVSLISSGKSTANSFFVDANPSGTDVFIRTRERLVGGDRDAVIDLYDARIGGGFPEPPPLLAPCEGDGCRQLGPPVPALQAPGSSTLRGPGNVEPGRRQQLRVAGWSRAAKRLATGGVASLRVRVASAGSVRLEAHATIGRANRVIAHVTKRFSSGSASLMRFRLSRPALEALGARGRLRVTVSVRVTGAASGVQQTLALKSLVRSSGSPR